MENNSIDQQVLEQEQESSVYQNVDKQVTIMEEQTKPNVIPGQECPNIPLTHEVVHGTVKFYNAPKNFGFIVLPGLDDELFFHREEIIGMMPLVGDHVTFSVGIDEFTRKKVATRVTGGTAKMPPPPKGKGKAALAAMSNGSPGRNGGKNGKNRKDKMGTMNGDHLFPLPGLSLDGYMDGYMGFEENNRGKTSPRSAAKKGRGRNEFGNSPMHLPNMGNNMGNVMMPGFGMGNMNMGMMGPNGLPNLPLPLNNHMDNFGGGFNGRKNLNGDVWGLQNMLTGGIMPGEAPSNTFGGMESLSTSISPVNNYDMNASGSREHDMMNKTNSNFSTRSGGLGSNMGGGAGVNNAQQQLYQQQLYQQMVHQNKLLTQAQAQIDAVMTGAASGNNPFSQQQGYERSMSDNMNQ